MSNADSRAKVLYASQSDFDQVVLQSAVPVLVDFYADWCPAGRCRRSSTSLPARCPDAGRQGEHRRKPRPGHSLPDQRDPVAGGVSRRPGLGQAHRNGRPRATPRAAMIPPSGPRPPAPLRCLPDPIDVRRRLVEFMDQLIGFRVAGVGLPLFDLDVFAPGLHPEDRGDEISDRQPDEVRGNRPGSCSSRTCTRRRRQSARGWRRPKRAP